MLLSFKSNRQKFMQSYLIHHFLEYSAEILPEKTAVIHGSDAISYRELNQRANQLAHFFCQQGLQKGDRVGILLENSIDFVIAYYAVAKAGAVAVPLNIELPDNYLQDVFNNCQIAAIICTSKGTKFTKKLLKDFPTIKFVIAQAEKYENWRFSLPEILANTTPDFPAPPMIDLDLAAIIYTSGSTGKPRGVMLSHLNLVQNSRAIVTYLELTSAARMLVVLPFFYIYGLSLLNTHFLVGGTLVLENRNQFPNLIVNSLKSSGANGFAGVPSTYALLLNRSTFRQEQFPALRYLTQAGGPMAPTLIQELMQLLPDKKLFIMYGATEASARLAYLDPRQLPNKIGSIGKAIPNVELKIVNENGEICKPGEIGEIVARGSNIMQGYWQDPDATAQVLQADGFHTGDLARMDHEGYLFIVGRKNDIIKSGAHRISAQEIEAILLQSPQVHEVAVIGVPDPLLGEAIQAFVVPKNKNNCTPQDLKQFCEQKMPKMKIPRRILLVEELPKNSAGKIMKAVLREQGAKSRVQSA